MPTPNPPEPPNSPPVEDIVTFLKHGEPEPGPPGYHADFTLPFGVLETASMWVIRVSDVIGDTSYGPFDTRDEALRWGCNLETERMWWAEALRKPDEWPGSDLEPPVEPETPLLDIIDGPKGGE